VYSTCLFCHGDLGRNESIEHFPVGRRLAFDGAKGRLWVVCRKCERWNLSPLEERWEAIEEAERGFRGTKLRVSTDHIGLAKLKEGLELVRIGEPQRPEMAAWRYGDQFGRRRKKRIALIGGAAVLVGGVMIGLPMVGIAGGGFFNALQLLNSGNSLYRAKKRISIPIPDGVHRMRLIDMKKVRLSASGRGVELEVPIHDGINWLGTAMNQDKYIRLHGEDAVRAASAILPRLNQSGGNAGEVTRAVEYLEETSDPVRLFHRAAKAIEERNRGRFMWRDNRASLRTLPTAGRLALEMATHEEAERRALEGELHILEEAWKEAEEIAAISDDLLLPESVESRFERLKRDGDAPSR
jgi:hypothetical protein